MDMCNVNEIIFRPIYLDDKEKVEKIRRKYHPALSDYTFALVYCWQEDLELTIHIEEDFYVIRSQDYYFFPIGSDERVRSFINELLDKGQHPVFRFCDKQMLRFLNENYDGKFEYNLAEEDCDYEVTNHIINELKDSAFAKRRNEYAHYKNGDMHPTVEIITEENMHQVSEISKLYSGEDQLSEKVAISEFNDLNMIGIIVKEGDRAVGFSLCSIKDEKTMQGHFMKCISKERGSKFFVMKSCIDAFSDRFLYTNMEDDMGIEGLRIFKSSFKPYKILSFTIRFLEDKL